MGSLFQVPDFTQIVTQTNHFRAMLINGEIKPRHSICSVDSHCEKQWETTGTSNSSTWQSSEQAVLVTIIKLNHLNIWFKAKQSGFVRFIDHFHWLPLTQYSGHHTAAPVLPPKECKHDTIQFSNYLHRNDGVLPVYEARTTFHKQLMSKQRAWFCKPPVGKQMGTVWDFKFSRRRVWSSELSSGMYCHAKWLSTDVSEVRAAQGWWRQHVRLKRRPTNILHGSTSQKTILNFKMSTGRLFPGVNRGRGVMLRTHLHLVTRSIMSRTHTSSPPWRLHGVQRQFYFYSFLALQFKHDVGNFLTFAFTPWLLVIFEGSDNNDSHALVTSKPRQSCCKRTAVTNWRQASSFIRQDADYLSISATLLF
jgi:hypothetical protein